MRQGVLWIAAATWLLVSCGCAQVQEIRDESFAPGGARALEIDVQNGDVTLGRSRSDSIEVVAELTTFGGKSVLEDTRLVFTPGAVASLEIDAPSGLIFGVTADLTISVPAGLAVAGVTVANGSISSSGLVHDGALETVNGDISLSGCTGSASIASVNGDIIVTSGSIILSEAGTTNGDITVTITAPSGEGTSLSSTNGDITAEVPSSASMAVEMDTVNGEIETTGLELTGDLDPDGGRATMNGGGPLLAMSTVNGDLTLSAGSAGGGPGGR